jgi:hypothetical protein
MEKELATSQKKLPTPSSVDHRPHHQQIAGSQQWYSYT